jgi:hypothetical protein
MKTSRRRRPLQLASCALLLTLASTHAIALPSVYAIDIHTISAGSKTVSNSCFRLSSTLGLVAPGYSSNAVYSLYAGFWSAAAARGVDELFFSGFEAC